MLAVAAFLSGCSGTGERSSTKAGNVEAALAAYLRQAPADVSDVDQDGRVTRVSCSRTGERYRDGDVFDCTIFHASQTAVEWCVAMVDSDLVTQNEDPAVPCTGHSGPAMEGPQ
jgi:hypothetical protein